MTEIEIKINSWDSSWTQERKNVFLYGIYEDISKLKSYCEIEIYLQHLAEAIQKDYAQINKDFNSRYVDKNKNEANYIATKYKLMMVDNG